MASEIYIYNSKFVEYLGENFVNKSRLDELLIAQTTEEMIGKSELGYLPSIDGSYSYTELIDKFSGLAGHEE